MPLLYYIEVAGIHTDPSYRCGGNRISKLAVRSDDRTAQTDGLSGCRSCSPHSLLHSGRIRFIQPFIQSNSYEACRTRSGNPWLTDRPLFYVRINKNRARKSPVPAVKLSYATNKNLTG